jgi:hypothetical protein
VSIRLVIAGLAVVLARTDPIGAPRPGDVPVELQPVQSSARVSGLDVPDPDGGPAWDLRTSHSFRSLDLNPSSPRPGLADAHPAR